jgi:aspartate ammonia-lyase
MSDDRPVRIERDVLGDIEVPTDVRYGAQTARATGLVNPSGRQLRDYPELVYALVHIKRAAAVTHSRLGVLSKAIAAAIVATCDEVLNGQHRLDLIVDVMSGGGGTAFHMNVNEVIAHRASEIADESVHANTHVNMGQSTNDVVPSAMKLATHRLLTDVAGALEPLIASTDAVASATADIVKVARTCLQDAVPMTLGQGFGAHRTALTRMRAELIVIAGEALTIPIGATAVGTGLGAVSGYRRQVVKELRSATGLDIRSDDDLFDGLANTDIHVRVSGALKMLALTVSKQAKDIRLMSSGPRAGLAEISIAPTQSGSSIMPGKVNPALPEMMIMVGHRAVANDLATTLAMSDGELDLNVWEPTVITALFETCRLLATTLPVYATECVATIRANTESCRRMADESLALAVVISTMFGYDEGARVALHASSTGSTIRDAAIELELLDAATADRVLDPLLLTDPNLSGALLDELLRH